MGFAREVHDRAVCFERLGLLVLGDEVDLHEAGKMLGLDNAFKRLSKDIEPLRDFFHDLAQWIMLFGEYRGLEPCRKRVFIRNAIAFRERIE